MKAPAGEKGLTKFQQECQERVRELLSQHGHSSDFEVVKGREEEYLFLDFVDAGREIGVYIYEDEAGFSVGKDWYISEAQDFDSHNDLIVNFLRKLELRVFAAREKD
jgi:hypothetical protein